MFNNFSYLNISLMSDITLLSMYFLHGSSQISSWFCHIYGHLKKYITSKNFYKQNKKVFFWLFVEVILRLLLSNSKLCRNAMGFNYTRGGRAGSPISLIFSDNRERHWWTISDFRLFKWSNCYDFMTKFLNQNK